MTLECHKCSLRIVNKDNITCSTCQEKYHLDCANISEKRFNLMTSTGRKKSWECTPCIKKNATKYGKTGTNIPTSTKKNPNVTLRKKQTVSTPRAFDSTSETILSADTTLDKSCPGNCTNDNMEDLEELRSKISYLETKLESAENEIERLVIENMSLKNEVSRCGSKINQLTNICRTPPKLDVVIKDNMTNETKSPCNTPKSSLDKNTLHTRPPKANPSSKSQKVISSTSPSSKAVSTSNNLPQRPENVTSQSTSVPSSRVENKRKICLISSNSQTRTRTIAERYISGNNDLCHYLLPGAGIKPLLQGIDNKTRDFTMQDYCIILLSNEDFTDQDTDNCELIAYIRETLQEITHTNILLCLPPFNFYKFDDSFILRIEIFNNQLYLDVTTHKYAFLIDSNRNLFYDNTHFNKYNGSLNKNGLITIFKDVNEAVNYVDNLSFDEMYDATQQASTAQFFRG